MIFDMSEKREFQVGKGVANNSNKEYFKMFSVNKISQFFLCKIEC